MPPEGFRPELKTRRFSPSRTAASKGTFASCYKADHTEKG